MKEKQPVVIIGGAGRMGSKTAELFRGLNHEVRISDIKNGFPTPQEVVTGNEIVLFSISPKEIPSVTNAIREKLTPANQVLDNATTKDPFIDSFNILDQRGISVCSTHPLCAPNVSWTGQKSVLIEVGKNFQSAKSTAIKLYEAAGMQVETLTVDEHRQHMLIHQAIPHLDMRLRGIKLANMGFSFEDLKRFATANSNLFYQASMARVWSQNPEISAEVIYDNSRSASQKEILNGFVAIPNSFPINNESQMIEEFKKAELVLFKTHRMNAQDAKGEIARKTARIIEAQKQIL